MYDHITLGKCITRAKTVAGVLNAAARITEKYGWSKRSYVEENGCMCLSGAVRVALGGNKFATVDSCDKKYDIMNGAFRMITLAYYNYQDEGRMRESSVIHINDQKINSRTEAVKLLRSAARYAKRYERA